MNKYDYIICGFGCAGMSLIFQLLQSPLKHVKIALVDESTKQMNDRTWCYWGKSPVPIHPKNTPLIAWDKVRIQLGSKQITKTLEDYRYYHIKSSDFYQEIFELLEQFPNVSFIQSKVLRIEANGNNSSSVYLHNGEILEASKTFTSIPTQHKLEPNTLKQVFLGWKIKTSTPKFDQSVATLMHFPKEDNTKNDFFYILPYANDQALVEYTLYTTEEVKTDFLKVELENYLAQHLSGSFDILFEEQGAIPMTTKIQGNQSNSSVIELGSIAGCIKPSTGYTFYDIQKHSEQIVQNLLAEDKQFKGWVRKYRYHFYDNILLNIAKKWPNRLPGIFAEMFEKNQGKKVLQFLQEETTLREDLQILLKFKFGIFIKSLLRYEQN